MSVNSLLMSKFVKSPTKDRMLLLADPVTALFMNRGSFLGFLWVELKSH